MQRLPAVITILSLLFASCSALPVLPNTVSSADWLYTDLRLLDPIDSTDPQAELIAAYARLTPNDLEIRLDLLNYASVTTFDLAIQLGFDSGASWVITSLHDTSPVVVSAADGSTPAIQPRLLHDLEMDCLVLRLNRALLPGNPQNVTISAALSQDGKVMDDVTSFSPKTPPPAAAPLLLAFWNTLPAATPAQALRRWDGAHTGPYGQRHGLSVLIQAASEAGVPLALLDLTSPASLSALELLNGSETLRSLQQNEGFILPLQAQSSPQNVASELDWNRSPIKKMDFSISPILYAAVPVEQASAYTAAFAQLSDTTHLQDYHGLRLIPLPQPFAAGEVSPDGISDLIKTALLNTALSAEPGDLIILGGSLPESPWADSTIAPLALRWLAQHPWIQPLDQDRLLAMPTLDLPVFPCTDLLCTPPGQTGDTPTALTLHARLEAMPPSSLRDSAWQAYFNLTKRTDNSALQQMQAAALEQIHYFIAAAEWQLKPSGIADCTRDIDRDNQPECVLASKDWFTILELDGGRLAFAAARSHGEIIEVIGPTSQLMLGLGEPGEWKAERGIAADPQAIPGAFADEAFPWFTYSPSVQPDEVCLTHPDGSRVKCFSMTGSTIQFNLQTTLNSVTAMRIPVLLAPAARFSPGWQKTYALDQTPDALLINGPDNATISVQAASMTTSSVIDSLQWLRDRENPNTEFSAGHYLPFPLILIDAQSPVEISIQP